MFKKLIVMALVLTLAVCAFVACGGPRETDPVTPETSAPQCNGEDIHDVEVEEALATCQMRGYRKETCKICGKVVVNTAYPKSACTPAAAATCTEDSICTVCGKVAEAAKGHDFDETTVAATCNAEGSVSKSCKVCGETETVSIPKLDHVLGTVTEEVAPADCSTPGYKKGTCTLCNQEVTVEIGASHAIKVGTKDVAAFTMNADGSFTATCTACKKEVTLTAKENLFALDFDEVDIKTELATLENAELFAITDASNAEGVCKTEGDRTVLSTANTNTKGAVFLDFDGSLLNGVTYYAVSFDVVHTKQGKNGTNSQGVTYESVLGFQPGYNEGKKVVTPGFDFFIKYDAETGRAGGVENATEATDANSVAVELNEWYHVVVVFTNVSEKATTFRASVYVNGTFVGGVPQRYMNDATVEAFQNAFCFRFSDSKASAPMYDNLRIDVLG